MPETCFSHLDIRLNWPICEHPPYDELGQLQWQWSIFTDMSDGITRHGMTLSCPLCSATVHILPTDLRARFVVGAASPKPDVEAKVRIRIQPRDAVRHERQFTRYDLRFLRAMGIRPDPEDLERLTQ